MFRQLGAPVFAVICIVLISCEARNSGEDEQIGTTDGTGSQVAVAAIADATDSADTFTGIALSVPRRPPMLLARAAELLNPVRTAYAAQGATYSCPGKLTPGNWNITGSTTEEYTPPDCEIVYASGGSGSVVWTGTWTLTYSGGASCVPAIPGGLVRKGGAQVDVPCTMTRTSTQPTGMVRTVTGPFGKIVVTEDTQHPGGYDPSIATSDTGVVEACDTAAGCPNPAVRGSGIRVIRIGGTHLVSDRNGKTSWNHTVSTDPADPLVVTGFGPSRVVQSGSLIVQFNAAGITIRTTVRDPLVHMAMCPYPTGGSLSSSFSGGKLTGKSETIVFGTPCGQATITLEDGAKQQVTLTN
jgi:hypothetical protein